MKSSRDSVVTHVAPVSDEFQPFLPPAAEAKHPASPAVERAAVPAAAELSASPVVESAKLDEKFKVPGLFLEALWGDAAFREQWDQVIAQRVQAKFAAEQETLRAQALAQAREEGIAQGIEASRALIAEAEDRLKAICQRVLEEKEALLRSHEKAWCDAMLHVLRRFLVRRPEEIVSVLQAWMDDCLKSFAQRSKIRVYLSEADHQQIARAFSFRKEANHEFGIDRNLASGEVRCECDGGGIFFSPGQELSELEGFLNGLFQSESGEGH